MDFCICVRTCFVMFLPDLLKQKQKHIIRQFSKVSVIHGRRRAIAKINNIAACRFRGVKILCENEGSDILSVYTLKRLLPSALKARKLCLGTLLFHIGLELEFPRSALVIWRHLWRDDSKCFRLVFTWEIVWKNTDKSRQIQVKSTGRTKK